MFGLFKKKDPDKLLKDATAAKKSGNMDEAVSLLREAYKAIAKGGSNYGVNPFLRLPLYLQEAKKPDEAWTEFKNLLTKGYPNQEPHKYPDIVPMDNSTIYDKMRLFLQRQSRNDEAVKFGILSHLSWGCGLYLQKRKGEFKNHVAANAIEDIVSKLLKKAKKTEYSDELSNIVKQEVKNIPNINYISLETKIDNVII